MAPKKKTKKLKGTNRTAAKKSTAKRSSAKKAASRKKIAAARKPVKKKPVSKVTAAKSKRGSKKPPAAKTARSRKNSGRAGGSATDIRRIAPTRPSGHLGDEAGDLQGLSRAERADSESVDELLEEGNAFEAGVVMGVEDADNADEQEVHTHEVPEDDVPDEYLDDDR